MTNEQLFDVLGDVREEYIQDAHVQKKRSPSWMRWSAAAACLLLVAGIAVKSIPTLPTVVGSANGGGEISGFWGTSDSTLLMSRRKQFTSVLTVEEEQAFAGVSDVLKFYRTLNNSWFMAKDLTDFSQVLEDKVLYIVPESMEGINGECVDRAYSIYTLDENGQPQWGMGVGSADGPKKVPDYFTGLTRAIIQEDLAGVAYEDYVIADSARLYTVFVWAKCADGEDVFITYPARPEFVGLENRGQYTLQELTQILTEMAIDS